MLIDARSLPAGEQLQTDVCVVGAGAAGISIAKELAGASRRVMLVEGGGLTFEHRSQFLHRGQSRGRETPAPENTRRRQFGGTTAAWFGRCRPLDEIDFEARPWFPHSGWPIPHAEVDRYVERALRLCEIRHADFHQESDALGQGGLESKPFYFSAPTHFGKTYLEGLRRAPNVRILLHANAAEIELEASGTAAARLVCLTLNRKRLTVAARIFVLATGGLENPRLLLNSRGVHPNGIGNSGDLVGRYFMEHIYTVTAAVTALPEGFPDEYLRLNYESFQRHLAPTPAIGLPQAVLRQQHLPNTAAFFVRRPLHKTDDRFYSSRLRGALHLVETIAHRRAPSKRIPGYLRESLVNASAVLPLALKAVEARLRRLSQYVVFVQIESVPNPASRITLSDVRDHLGLNEICVDWQLLPQDLDGLHRCEDILLRGLGACGVQTRRIQHDLDPEGWPVSLPYSKHHMGTTRMSRDPRSGVVDENCRVHGINNLYIAGSSVFPTAGMANPTLTIVALAVRLADHIKHVLGS